jgi:chromosomal replication initiation ATPase DnaA
MKYADMIRIVFEAEGLDPSDLSRRGRLPETRAICYTLGKMNTRLSLDQLGEPFGFNHATVLHGLKQIQNLSQTDKDLKHRLKQYYALTLEIEERSFGILLQN